MVYHNTPEGYKPVEPNDEHIVAFANFQATPEQRDGLFYRTDVPIDLAEAQQRLLDGNATLQDYQYWVDTAWKVEHGTYAAVERFGDKLYEEHRELAAELVPLRDNQPIDVANTVSEAGDVLWCATALASVATADIDSGFKNILFRYVMGVQHIKGRQTAEPVWRPMAAATATKYGQLTLTDIDTLLSAGFEPLPSPIMNIFEPEEAQGDIHDHMLTSLALCAAVRNLVDKQYAWGGDLDMGELSTMVLPEEFRATSRKVGELVASIYLETAWIVHRATELTVKDTIKANVQKLTTRIATNTVDKSDGDRPK